MEKNYVIYQRSPTSIIIARSNNNTYDKYFISKLAKFTGYTIIHDYIEFYDFYIDDQSQIRINYFHDNKNLRHGFINQYNCFNIYEKTGNLWNLCSREMQTSLILFNGGNLQNIIINKDLFTRISNIVKKKNSTQHHLQLIDGVDEFFI